MNAVVYYSNTGESRRIAQYLAGRLSYELFDIWELPTREFHNLVIVFPIHCQSIPKALKGIFSKLVAKNVALIATYGRMSHGNALYECSKRYGWNIIAGAYLPTKHSYIKDDSRFEQFEVLEEIIEKISLPAKIRIPRSFKNPLANIFPRLRSVSGVRLIRTDKCTDCGYCQSACRHNGCIRCLRCVAECPTGALDFKLNIFMRMYLGRKKKNKIIIYK